MSVEGPYRNGTECLEGLCVGVIFLWADQSSPVNSKSNKTTPHSLLHKHSMNYRMYFPVFKRSQEKVDKCVNGEGMKWKIGHLGQNTVENEVISESSSTNSSLTQSTTSPTDNPDYVKLQAFEKSSFRYLKAYNVVYKRTTPRRSQKHALN